MAEQVTVSRKYQVVIPQSVRQQVPIQPGQKLMVTVKHGLISLVPIVPLEKLQGMLRGADPSGYREEEDRA